MLSRAWLRFHNHLVIGCCFIYGPRLCSSSLRNFPVVVWHPRGRGLPGARRTGGHVRSTRTEEPSPPAGSVGSDVFIDWAKPYRVDGTTKGIGVIGVGAKRSRKLTFDELQNAYPPPRRLFIEGIPTLRRDGLLDLGYEVYICKTTTLPELRRARRGLKSKAMADEVSSQVEDEIDRKGDMSDPRSLRDFSPGIRWHKAQRTEPYVVEAKRLLGNRELLLTLRKIAAHHASSESYKDISYFREKQAQIDGELKEFQKKVERFCKETNLHMYHREVYGAKCLATVTAVSKRPWAYGRRSWRKLNGCTDAARHPEIVTRHSLGSDSTLKSVLYGAVPVLIGRRSPYRPIYENKRAILKLVTKRGKSGRGSFKVTPHARAINRVITMVVGELRSACIRWHAENQGGGDVQAE